MAVRREPGPFDGDDGTGSERGELPLRLALRAWQVACSQFEHPEIIHQPGRQRRTAGEHGGGAEQFEGAAEKNGAHRAVCLEGAGHRKAGSDEHRAANVPQMPRSAQEVARLECRTRFAHAPGIAFHQQCFNGFTQFLLGHVVNSCKG